MFSEMKSTFFQSWNPCYLEPLSGLELVGFLSMVEDEVWEVFSGGPLREESEWGWIHPEARSTNTSSHHTEMRNQFTQFKKRQNTMIFASEMLVSHPFPHTHVIANTIYKRAQKE